MVENIVEVVNAQELLTSKFDFFEKRTKQCLNV